MAAAAAEGETSTAPSGPPERAGELAASIVARNVAWGPLHALRNDYAYTNFGRTTVRRQDDRLCAARRSGNASPTRPTHWVESTSSCADSANSALRTNVVSISCRVSPASSCVSQ